MRNLLKALAFLVGFLPTLAAAQSFPTVPSGTVIGRTQAGSGPAQAIPLSQLIATMLASSPTIPTLNTSSIIYKGSSSGQATVQAQATAGTPTILWPNTSGTVADGATSPIVLDPVSGNISCPTCEATRSQLSALDLHLFSGVRSFGYSVVGDGGAADFVNVGTAPFIDSNIQNGSIVSAGSSCTNGTYFGVTPSGGTGLLAMATVVASGGVVTSVTLTYPGNGYSVNDVLTGTITGCTFTWKVSAVTTPTGSFTDSVGTHFQIQYPARGIDARTFGVKFDWITSDTGATDNYTTLNNVYRFAGAQTGNGPDTGGVIGGLVLLPKGTAMYCGSNGAATLSQPYGVTVRGQGPYESALKPCDAWGTSTNFYELCNSQSHLACFGTLFDSAQIYQTFSHDAGVSSVASLNAVYTNNCQQEGCGLRNAVIYPGACRRAITFETGYGGASLVHAMDDVEIKGGETNANCGGGTGVAVFINYGTTEVTVDRLTIGGLSASFGPRPSGMLIEGGFVDIHAFYAENVVSPLIVQIPTSLANGMVTLHNATAGTSCTWLVQLTSTNQPGNFLIGGPMATNSCSSGIVQDSQSGGSNMTTPQVSDKIFFP